MKDTNVRMPRRIAVHALNEFAADQGCRVVKTEDGFALQPIDPYANVMGIGRLVKRHAPTTPAPGGSAA